MDARERGNRNRGVWERTTGDRRPCGSCEWRVRALSPSGSAVLRKAAPVIALAVALAACGSSDSGDSASSGSGSGGGGVAAARAAVTEAKAEPKFTLKAPTFDAEDAARGKTIFNIPSFSGIPFYDVGDAEMKRIAEELGARFIEYPNQGSPQEWGKGIEQAIAQKADVIHLGGTNPNLNIPQLQNAKRAGIPVVLTQIYNTGSPVPGKARSLITAQRTAPFNDAARLDVDYAVAASDGKAEILVSTSNEQPPNPGMVEAIKDEAERVCPDGCSVAVDNVPLTDWASRITPETQSSLVENPKINWAIPIYDAQTDYVIAGIRSGGRVGKVSIATYNGSAATLKEIQQDDIVKMDVGENLYWIAWANMDTVLRVLAGAPPVPGGDQQTPLRVFDDSNVSEAGTPPKDGRGYGVAYVAGYNKLWKTSITVNPSVR